ncbi:MAG TPA: S8 family serine peptidase [Candidatus Kapabacteria bacterium]|nr:S8 family serine peptidase [Candidatus Kapabacteria bacterium]
MKNFILFLTIVCFVTLSIKIIPQMKQSYIITINDSLNLSPYLNSDGYINTNMLNEFMNSGGNGNSLLSDFNSFIKLANPTSLRKLLRKVPYDIKQLHSKRGIDFNLNEIHRLHVIETYEKIDFEKIKSFNCITSIIPNIVTKVDEWPPNDPNYSSQTQFWSTNYNLNLPVAWQYTDGNSGIKIGILDHGVDYRHTDLGAGFGEGYRIRGGWDWKDNDGNPLPDLSNSVIENHGTPIAGILGALNNNGIGVIGIAGGWNTVNSGSQIFSFRVSSDQLDEDGRRYIDHTLIAEALIEAVTDPSINNGYGYGINVVNCSFGGITPNYWDWSSLFYHSYYNAFMWSILNNAVVVASRGNEASNSPRYPASFSNGKILLSVSGVDNFGIFYSQSSYGDGVSLSANWSLGLTTKNNFSYGSFGGTSNSAPFVSGSSALLFAKYLERNINVFSEDIQQILKISTQDAGASGYDQYYGYGRLDIAKALYMSSEKFNLTHLFANVDRNIINVSNPGANLALYYPYGLYPIIETKQLTESVDLPAYFESDSVWTWGNTYTWGVEWSNPSYGLPGATFVSKVGRRITYKTYIYKHNCPVIS